MFINNLRIIIFSSILSNKDFCLQKVCARAYRRVERGDMLKEHLARIIPHLMKHGLSLNYIKFIKMVHVIFDFSEVFCQRSYIQGERLQFITATRFNII